MEIKVLVLGLIFFLLSACASQTLWYLNGRTEQQFHIDDAQCQGYAYSTYQAQGAYYAGAGVGSGDSTLAGLGALLAAFEGADINAKHANCMQQMGYTPAN